MCFLMPNKQLKSTWRFVFCILRSFNIKSTAGVNVNFTTAPQTFATDFYTQITEIRNRKSPLCIKQNRIRKTKDDTPMAIGSAASLRLFWIRFWTVTGLDSTVSSWKKQPSHNLTFTDRTRRPASADRTARRQFQATGQPVSRTQASDAMTSRLPRYEAKCVQHTCFQCGSVPLRSDIKGMELPLPIYWYHAKGNWLRYNFAADSFYTMKHCSRLFVLYCRSRPKDDKSRHFDPHFLRKLGAA